MYKKRTFILILFFFLILFNFTNTTYAQKTSDKQIITYLQIPEKTTIKLINIDNLSSKENHKYDLVYFRLLNDFKLDNDIILPKDTQLEGLITKIHASRIFGQSAVIRIKLKDVRLADGSILQFDNDLKLKGGQNYTNIASSVIVPFSGMLFKGKEINCPSGSILEYTFK